MSEQMKLVELELTPSSFENRKESAEKDDPSAEKRPKGNIFGNVMHRSFELLVLLYKSKMGRDEAITDEQIREIVDKAILESAADIEDRYKNRGGYEAAYKDFMDYLPEKLREFIDDETVIGLLESAGVPENIHPEYPFSLVTDYKAFCKDIDGNEDILKRLSKMGDISDDTRIWVHGISDLVIEIPDDDRILILDYKSDVKRSSESTDEFESVLFARYRGQLALYEYAMKKAFGDDKKIGARLYHLY